ncbi:MAG: DUF2490 domain-containing protein [Bacteroidales bacterium]|nr:DUF2490 domain-containing protein [Bacteroidales bacterium]
MNIRIFFIVVLLLLSGMAAKARSRDFGIWTGVQAEKKWTRWSWNGELELRMRDNARTVGRWGLKLGGNCAVVKNLRIGAAYQFLYFHDTEYDDFQPRHRLTTFALGKQKWGNFAFSLREKIQVTTKDESDRIKKSGKIDTYKINPAWSWRNRLKIACDIPRCRFTPAISAETFYQLNRPDGNRFNGVRIAVSVACRIDRKSTLNISGIYHRDVNEQRPQDRLVTDVCYAYSF